MNEPILREPVFGAFAKSRETAKQAGNPKQGETLPCAPISSLNPLPSR